MISHDTKILMIENIRKALLLRHFDGNGCGTHDGTACSVCFGPSPMDAREVAEVVVAALDTFVTELDS